MNIWSVETPLDKREHFDCKYKQIIAINCKIMK